jgi:hypothetical protein
MCGFKATLIIECLKSNFYPLITFRFEWVPCLLSDGHAGIENYVQTSFVELNYCMMNW